MQQRWRAGRFQGWAFVVAACDILLGSGVCTSLTCTACLGLLAAGGTSALRCASVPPAGCKATHLAGDGDTVVHDLGGAVLGLEHHVAALGGAVSRQGRQGRQGAALSKCRVRREKAQCRKTYFPGAIWPRVKVSNRAGGAACGIAWGPLTCWGSSHALAAALQQKWYKRHSFHSKHIAAVWCWLTGPREC